MTTVVPALSASHTHRAVPEACGAPLWAISSYFNPIGYASRLTNYRTFRQRLTVPLVTVELARSCDKFQLQPGDADILIQLVGEDLLWQKERLLNIALGAVPSGCSKIAWLDCDVVFERDDWGQRTSDALEQFTLVHAFSTFSDLRPEGTAHGRHPTATLATGWSSFYKRASGTPVEELFRPGRGNRLMRGSTAGLAWAARREVLQRHGFYDACIVGSGGTAMLAAALGRFELIAGLDLNERQMAHYMAWARPYHADVRDDIGYVDGGVYHLWHGSLEDRKYRQRHFDLKRFAFDPFVDIAIDTSGAWCWNTEKRDMHAYVKQYFEARSEDGSSRDSCS